MLISSGTLSLPFCRVVRQVAPITSYVHKLNNITNAVLMRLKTEIFTTAKGHKPTMTPYGEDAKTLTSRICDAIIASSSLGAFRIFCIARIFQHIPNSKFSALYSRGVLEIYYLYNMRFPCGCCGCGCGFVFLLPAHAVVPVCRNKKNKVGYRKVVFCGEQAARDNLRYFWVDTCCTI
jgi:hypothetical protein